MTNEDIIRKMSEFDDDSNKDVDTQEQDFPPKGFVFDLDKIPKEVLDKAWTSYRPFLYTKDLPVMMYVHGFMSGANGAKQRQLQKRFKNRYRVIAPELDADPDKSLAILNDIIAKEKPVVIVGTSLGGWMTLMCESGSAKLIIVNPVIDPVDTLSRWLDKPQTYFCQRLDGVQTYTLTREVLDLYTKYDTMKAVRKSLRRLHALCSTKDELIGSCHVDALVPVMPKFRIMVVDDFGHQCRDAGLEHLYNIIEDLTDKE